MRLPRSSSITQRAVFARVKTTGHAKAGRFVIVSTLEEPSLNSIRTGFITTRRSAKKAHDRVRLRRWFRSLVQQHAPSFEKSGRYLVTIARPNAGSATYQEIADDWHKQARRLGLFGPKPS